MIPNKDVIKSAAEEACMGETSTQRSVDRNQLFIAREWVSVDRPLELWAQHASSACTMLSFIMNIS